MRQIYTYTDFKSLLGEPYYNLICSYPHISVSRGLRDGLNENNPLKLKYRVADFQDVLRIIANHWNDGYDSMNKAALASEFFHQLIQNAESESKKQWLRDCRRNTFFLLSSLVLLNEAGVEPQDITVNSKDIGLLKQLYEYISANDNSIQNLFESMESLKEVNNCKSFLTQLFGDCNYDSIIINSFYYITPIQERVLIALEQCGFNLIFLIPYDGKYKYIYEIWEKTYSKDKGYPHMEDWIKTTNHLCNPLGDIFINAPPKKSKISIHENKSVINCVENVQKTRRLGYSIYSTDHAHANEIFHDFMPQEFERRNLLSYPIGKFIQSIHSMWDTDSESIIIEEDSIKTCFASGWLSFNGKSSDEYLDEFSSIYPYFQGCSQLSEWKDRLTLLDRTYVILESSFDDSNEKIQFLSNPLLNFSFYSLSKWQFQTVKAMMIQLFDFIEIMFGDQSPLTIAQHFKKIELFIKENCPKSKTDGDELLVLKNIMNKVSFDPNCKLYSPSDVGLATLFLLQQGFDSFGDDGSIKKGMVNPFYQLDSANINPSSKIHIVLADIDRLPGEEKKYVWPLSKPFILDLYHKSIGEKKYLLSDLIHIMESFPVLNRYMLFSSLNNDDVIISWISEMGGKKLQPSPFIRLLSDKCNIPIDSNSHNYISYNEIKELQPLSEQIRSSDIRYDDKLIKDARIDYSLCPLKFIYGFVLQNHPSFQSSFNIKMAIRGLLQSLIGLNTGVSEKETINKVFSLFPFITKSEKRQIIDFSFGERIANYTEYNGYKYSENRFLVEYPTKKYRDIAMLNYGMLLNQNGRTGFNLQKLPDIESVCTYCQHSDYCRRSLHQNDELPGLSDE